MWSDCLKSFFSISNESSLMTGLYWVYAIAQKCDSNFCFVFDNLLCHYQFNIVYILKIVNKWNTAKMENSFQESMLQLL